MPLEQQVKDLTLKDKKDDIPKLDRVNSAVESSLHQSQSNKSKF